MTDAQDRSPHPYTVAAAHGVASDPAHGAVAPPLYLSSTYEFAGFDQPRSFDYGRAGNPTRDLLAEALAKLEGGAGAIMAASGMAALDLLVGRLRPGDLIVAPHDCYGGTMRLLKARAERGHCTVQFVDQGDHSAFAAALKQMPTLILIETPSNPLMRVVDIASLSARGRAAGAAIAVDNTFLSPAVQQPLALGADYVIHSTTKYLNGHSDVIGGAVVAADPAQVDELRAWANVVGSAGAPFDAWLTLRGLRTLFPRMQQQQRNALAVAQYLASHPAVARVHYPGLPADPNHEVAARQQHGFGAMLSFELTGGLAAVRHFVSAVRYFTLAESLGGIESLVAHPATMTHADMGKDARDSAGISDSLLRLSVGLEAEDDLISGLEAGLAGCPL
ncbi:MULTISPECIES: cystathionine gamma-synthase [Sphingomonadaceae]|jgi:cystathionine gamma-synthase|uniref:cystathionine gamma-synthase n=1 Tax=Sphingomonadaceae TaxID=41297 RepID=UPI0006F457D3|nr:MULTISPECIES: cystathionine gamma-synthase [unclassified Sphingomonas]TXH82428.1 MAG: cystathionine gamma-synthase [Rhizobium sp.]HWV12774.1 cystathionine gamma-synthase [Sphingobium sp.]KQX24153.1 O-succinylhomoserine (thiol)-lyase [Sphingomonas sp. Root1294]KQY69673.1 O-succinylhomoserine (thiol)-lyase [Sphingomonas sp. Root50]KRB93453.1 O-succinylhomoserine (thiol)-lyase [Sphingomonas sp. Root720]